MIAFWNTIRRAIRTIKIVVNGQSLLSAYKLSKFVGSYSIYFQKNIKVEHQSLSHIPSKSIISIDNMQVFKNSLPVFDFFCKTFEVTQIGNGICLQSHLTDNPVKVLVHSYEQAEIFREIFWTCPYGFRVNNRTVVLDIGMNLGFASLFFASYDNVDRVYAYELVPSTYEAAINNIKLNCDLANKIISFSKGVADRNMKLEIPYAYAGSVGASVVRNLGEKIHGSSTVECIGIEKVLNDIYEKETAPLFVKMDCEGSEYAIIAKMAKLKLFSRIQGMAIEWHDDGYDTLVKILLDNGFAVFYSVHALHDNVGFIYAVNQNVPQ